jgi:hypothetical protein
MDTGDLERAEGELEMGLRTAREYRIDRIEGICATNLAWTLLRGGRCADAAEAAQRGAEQLRSIGAPEAETAKALVSVAEGPRSSSSEVLALLHRAAAASRSNPDFHTPDPGVLAHMAGELTGAGSSA